MGTRLLLVHCALTVPRQIGEGRLKLFLRYNK
jgi:hypothetical protein